MVTIYVEGGGDRASLKADCRRGFTEFLLKAGLAGQMPAIVACGSRGNAFERFCTAHNSGKKALLLVDSEDPMTHSDPWTHLKQRDNWTPPADAAADQCHLMVQVMETWFLADPDELARFFGSSFRKTALPKNPDLEAILKQDVYSGLKAATGANFGRGYGKGKHSFKILARINPIKVANESAYAQRLLDKLRP